MGSVPVVSVSMASSPADLILSARVFTSLMFRQSSYSVGTASPRDANRSHKSLNSRSLKISASASRDGSPTLSSSRSVGMGTKRSMVTSFRLKSATSRERPKVSFNFFFVISPRFSKTPSKDPNSCTSDTAVFSPTPRTPGILSEVSPERPMTSINFSGSNP